jgi:hypothetical protein
MPDVTVTLSALPVPCSSGQIYTLKWVCNSEGNGGTFALVPDATGGSSIVAPPVDHGGILEELRKSKFTADQIIKFFETIKPAKCGQ